MKPIFVLLILLLLPYGVSAVTINEGVIFNLTNVSIHTGGTHSDNSLSLHSNYFLIDNNVYEFHPTNGSLNITNFNWGESVSFVCNSTVSDNSTWFNFSKPGWKYVSIDIYINNNIVDNIKTAAGSINYSYIGGFGEKSFKFIIESTIHRDLDITVVNSFEFAAVVPILHITIVIITLLSGLYIGKNDPATAAIGIAILILLLTILYVGLHVLSNMSTSFT